MLRTLYPLQHIRPLNILVLLAKTYLMPRLLCGCEIFAYCDSTSKSRLTVAHKAILMVFSVLPKNAISCLFLKNVSPSKRVICFILNNLHFPMVEGIAFYALHKSRVLIIPCKAEEFCLFIGLPDEI